jgi:hypothetical protein
MAFIYLKISKRIIFSIFRYLQMAFNDQISAVINKLHDVGGLKFGDYMMKSGRRSPIYVDLRVIISHPKLMVFLIYLDIGLYNIKFSCWVNF